MSRATGYKIPETRSAADLLAVLEGEGFEAWRDEGGNLYATLARRGRRSHHKLEQEEVSDWVREQVRSETEKPLTAKELDDVLSHAREQARNAARPYQTAIRIGWMNGGLYLDLGVEADCFVECREGSWGLTEDPPDELRFLRSRGQRSLPIPKRGGDIGLLRRLVPGEETTFRLVVAWLMAALAGRPPFPILAISGGQGSGKSQLTRHLQDALDPHEASNRSFPRREEDLFTAAGNAHILAFDNLSTLNAENSDWLCRIATGATHASRKFFRQGDEYLIKAARPVILNGITELASRGDLIDRTLPIALSPPPAGRRMTEEELALAFRDLHPDLLGGLLDVLAFTQTQPKPEGKRHRLAAFSDLTLQIEPMLGWDPGSTLRALEVAQGELYDLALDESPLHIELEQLLEATGTPWVGSAQNLLAALTPSLEDRSPLPRWARSASGLGKELARSAPALLRAGIRVSQGKETSGKRRRTWTIERVGS